MESYGRETVLVTKFTHLDNIFKLAGSFLVNLSTGQKYWRKRWI